MKATELKAIRREEFDDLLSRFEAIVKAPGEALKYIEVREELLAALDEAREEAIEFVASKIEEVHEDAAGSWAPIHYIIDDYRPLIAHDIRALKTNQTNEHKGDTIEV